MSVAAPEALSSGAVCSGVGVLAEVAAGKLGLGDATVAVATPLCRERVLRDSGVTAV